MKNSAEKPTYLFAFLILVVIVQFSYPFTTNDSPFLLIVYQFGYLSLVVAGILVARNDRKTITALTVTGLCWIAAGISYAFNPDALWANLAGYIFIAIFQIIVTKVLLTFIFTSKTVSRDVLFAACAVYLLIGAIYIPIYGLIETLSWFSDVPTHAFVDGSYDYADIAIPWQTFSYYSYSTLTTLGYGDVLPVSLWARAVSSLEAISGTLYLTIIVARLVGLYASRDGESEAA